MKLLEFELVTFAETYRNICIEINITKVINPNPNGESWSGVRTNFLWV